MNNKEYTFIKVKNDGTEEITKKLKSPYKIEKEKSNLNCAIIRPLYGISISDVGKYYCLNTGDNEVLVIKDHPETNFSKETLVLFNNLNFYN